MRLNRFTDAINEVTRLWNAGKYAEARRIARGEFESIKRCCSRIDPDTGCWIWEEDRKYPQFTYGERVHRVVAALRYGDLGELDVHHMCGNACCVNPEHLQLVTRSQNVAEMIQRTNYEKFIVMLLEKVKEYNPKDDVFTLAMPGNVAERMHRKRMDITPKKKRGSGRPRQQCTRPAHTQDNNATDGAKTSDQSH